MRASFSLVRSTLRAANLARGCPRRRISAPGETKLAAMVFADGGCEFPESTEANEAFTAPTGTPALTVETSLTPAAGWLVADAAVPAAGQSYGPYTLKEGPTGSCTNIGAIWLGWEVAIPEQ